MIIKKTNNNFTISDDYKYNIYKSNMINKKDSIVIHFSTAGCLAITIFLIVFIINTLFYEYFPILRFGYILELFVFLYGVNCFDKATKDKEFLSLESQKEKMVHFIRKNKQLVKAEVFSTKNKDYYEVTLHNIDHESQTCMISRRDVNLCTREIYITNSDLY